MPSQNPIFIPSLANIPERLRQAVDAPTIERCSASFGEMFKPLFPGVEDDLKTKTSVATAQECYRATASALSEVV